MTERGLLPQFIREALEQAPGGGDLAEGGGRHGGGLQDGGLQDGGLQDGTEPAVLRTLLSLESALSAGAAPVEAPSSALLGRLQATLSEAPHRYAPFYTSAAKLFDLPEADVIAQLARLKDPSVWSFAGLPGIAKVKVVGGPRVANAETLFVRFNAGVRFPAHQHVGLEQVLVLEGSYEDSNGVLHRAGELREWPSETAHSFRVGPETCIFASVVFGRRFSSWPLRALARVLGS